MANFDTQIQALAGTATQTEMDDWATDAVKEIINILPPELKMECSTITNLYIGNTDTVMDLDVTGEISHVTRENADSGYFAPCRKIHPMHAGLISDSSSLHYATVTDPVYWIESDSGGDPKLHVYPTATALQPAKVYHITYPTVDVSAVSAIVNFPNEAEYLVVLYTAVKVLQNKMNEKSSDLPADVPSITLSTISTSLPSYTSVDSFISVAPPSAPTMSAQTVTLNGTAPVYTPPVFLGEAPTYTPQVVAPDFGDANYWLNTEEDAEMVAARLGIIQAQLKEYQSDIQNELNRFNKENTEYQTNLKKYATDIQNALNDFNKENVEYQANIQKDLQDANLAESKEGRDLQKYSQEIASYQAQVQTNVQKFQSDLADNTANFTNDLQKYASEIQKVTEVNQSNLTKYSQDLANYGAKIQKQSTHYQWLQGQYAQLKQDYNQGIQLLIGGGNPPQQKGDK